MSITDKILLETIEDAIRKNITELDLSRKNLERLPDDIGELFSLQVLNLENNFLKCLPNSMHKLFNLKELNLSNNLLEEIPKYIFDLPNLEKLLIDGNNILFPPKIVIHYGINAVRKWFESCRKHAIELIYYAKRYNKKSLCLSNQSLRKIPEEVFIVKNNIEKLILSNNRFINLPIEVFNFKKLKILECSHCDIEYLWDDFDKLKNLTHLYLDNNRIDFLPNSLSLLKKLKCLDINNNPICDIPFEIGELTSLERLDLSQKDYRPEFLKKSTPIIYKINPNLLPESIGRLKNLVLLNVSHRGLKQLPKEIINLNKLKWLMVEGNPLENPPYHIANQGIDAVREWYKSIEKHSEVSELTEAKIIFIGNCDVGKTTIVKNLLDKEYKLKKHQSTEGLEVIKWKSVIEIDDQLVEIQYNIWDFGGQGKYRPIQQFFCTSNALYVYVEDPVNKNKNHIDYYITEPYWLSMAQALGYDRDKGTFSPLIYISNKIDLNNNLWIGNEKNELGNIHNNIIKFIKVSCKTGKGLDSIKDAIKENYKSFGIIRQLFNKSWLSIKQFLENHENEIISKEQDYLKLCLDHGLSLEQSEIWLNSLVTIGAVLVFPQIVGFEDKIIIKPNWARKVAYRLLDSELVINNGGYFCYEDCRKIWPHITNPTEIIALLKAFEICYEIDDFASKKYFVPLLFPPKIVENFYKYYKTEVAQQI